MRLWRLSTATPLLLALAFVTTVGGTAQSAQAHGGESVLVAASRTPLTYVIVENSFLPSPTNSVSVSSRPARLQIGSADSTVTLRNIVWQGWGNATAHATASGTTCGSGGPEGYVCDSGTVMLSATNVVSFAGAHYYANVAATGIPDYGPNLVSLPTQRPSMATLSADCGYRYHAGHAVGDGEFSGGVMRGAINISCAAAWSLVRPHYASVLRAEQTRLTHFRVGPFRCSLKPTGPVTEKVCRRGHEQFFFL
jgi:hypothetical protein